MRIIVISNPEPVSGEANIINALFSTGLECLHLRKPNVSEYDLGKLIEDVDPAYRERISLHQHHGLARNSGISRLHFPEYLRLQQVAGEFDAMKTQFILSTSIHHLDQWANLSNAFDYAFFGPVFDSISKDGYRGILDQNFILPAHLDRVPLIALGGISAANLRKVRKMNFDGCAVLGEIWREPENAQKTFLKLKVLNEGNNQHKK